MTSCERPTISCGVSAPIRAADGPRNASRTGRTGPRTSTAGPSERGNRAISGAAHEIGTAAHDPARAVDHARNAARLDRPDPDLPLLPTAPVPKTSMTERAVISTGPTSRIRSAGEYGPEADAKFFLDAARHLYNAARRDVEAGRDERAGELARAAEAMTHVPEHLSNAGAGRPGGPGARGVFDPTPPEPKKKDRDPVGGVFGPPPGPKGQRSGTRDRDLPPPLR